MRDQLSLQIHMIDFEITAREDEISFLKGLSISYDVPNYLEPYIYVKKNTGEIKRLKGIKEIMECTLEELEREQREEDEK